MEENEAIYVTMPDAKREKKTNEQAEVQTAEAQTTILSDINDKLDLLLEAMP